MDSDRCKRPGCTGTLEDGYCNVCGLADIPGSIKSQAVKSQALGQKSSAPLTGRSTPATTGTGSSPLTNRSKGSRRTSPSSARSSRRQLGAGLVSIPELPSTDPEKAILPNPSVPDNKRLCGNCNNALRREKGFCSQCGQKYSFTPSLKPGDVISGQYEVKGAIAYGGLGWIYLGFDKTLARYVVLKGLLNTEDAASAAVAVAERKFLAAVKHPNIVGIYNFVNHGSEGFIVMEYVGGQTLKALRKERGPLPVAEAIAYIHRILSAFAYLHSQGLVYCDFKPDNVMLEGDDVKLIDMGGVRRIDDLDGDIYGTVGYSAPEAGEGPTIVSDLFTVGRTLAILLADLRGFTSTYQYTLPNAADVPVFAQQESLYRLLLKATAENPDDRLQSADEMADQLLGVLREVVALNTNVPRPATSTVFNGDRLPLIYDGTFAPIQADYQQIPLPLIDATDPAFNALLNASAIAQPSQRVAAHRQVVQQFPTSAEALLQLANALIDLPDAKLDVQPEIEHLLKQVEEKDPWDWRVLWYRGRALMAQGKATAAQAAFDQVYFDLPGELAPKLALGLAAEQAHNYKLAITLYDLVSRTDPGYGSAVFGLARCHCAMGDRAAAVAALERIPQSSSLYTRARVEIARTLIDRDRALPGVQELKQAAAAIEALTLEGLDRHRLAHQILDTALFLMNSQKLPSEPDLQILGQPLREVNLRKGLEQALRAMAHLATGEEKIRLVDEANRVRPRTVF